MGGSSKATTQILSKPSLESSQDSHYVLVDGKPFLILGAELQNSSFSCPEFMRDIWPVLKATHANTILANASWEAIEPEEGIFNFTKLDQVLCDARVHGFHLILLWFGAFKNGKSTYVPSWIKKNSARFPRAIIRKPKGQTLVTDVLSIFQPATVEADSIAFRALMRHIREVDCEHSTVIMVQVENEVGLLGDSRDASQAANEVFNRDVPEEFIAMVNETWDLLHPSLQKNLKFFRQQHCGTEVASWPEMFGNTIHTEELFMAYHLAQYVEQVASAGKTEYALPMFTNVWQNYIDEDTDQSVPIVAGGGGEPGDYPSGGGVINVLDIWQHFAPSLDFIAPDLYLNDYNAVCAKYRHRGQPLFIPEQRRDEYGARRIWSAYGAYQALCAAPFGIDSMSNTDNPWPKHFGLLAQISPFILSARLDARPTFGFFFDEYVDGRQQQEVITTTLGEWRLGIERSFVFGRPGPGFGMVIQLGPARFLLVGEGFQVRFSSTNNTSVFTGILSFVEKTYDVDSGRLVEGRILNGDETRTGELAIMPNESPDGGDFPISITIPARSRIAECEVYALL